jgi:hypothetical protein
MWILSLVWTGCVGSGRTVSAVADEPPRSASPTAAAKVDAPDGNEPEEGLPIQLDQGTVQIVKPGGTEIVVGVVGVADNVCGGNTSSNEVWVTARFPPSADFSAGESFWLDSGLFGHAEGAQPSTKMLRYDWKNEHMVDPSGTIVQKDLFCKTWRDELVRLNTTRGVGPDDVRCWVAQSCATPFNPP